MLPSREINWIGGKRGLLLFRVLTSSTPTPSRISHPVSRPLPDSFIFPIGGNQRDILTSFDRSTPSLRGILIALGAFSPRPCFIACGFDFLFYAIFAVEFVDSIDFASTGGNVSNLYFNLFTTKIDYYETFDCLYY